MTFPELAKRVSDYFKEYMKEEEYTTFEEMRKSQMWDSQDVRFEICQAVKECGGDCFDDGSFIEIRWEQMQYGAFKKLVMQNLKKL